jgi:hypothetical protein
MHKAILALVSLLTSSLALSADQYLERSKPFLPILAAQVRGWWATAPYPSVFAGQVEQESGWKQKATLRTSREFGAGFSQVTKTAKFDSIRELRSSFPTAFSGWGWSSNVYDPSYQLRAVILLDYRNYKSIIGTANDREHMAMALVSYNGGLGGLNSDRRICSVSPGCDPSKWFGNVEKFTSKAHTPVKGYGESFACTMQIE